jgi:DnaK suppressor protein
MVEKDVQRLKGILESKYTELSGASRNREDIAIENTPDSLDQVQLMGERELAIRNLDRDAGVLRQIRQALARIANDSYGVCARCDQEIAPKRISAIPWAVFCVKCQEYVDRQKADGGDDVAELYEIAA